MEQDRIVTPINNIISLVAPIGHSAASSVSTSLDCSSLWPRHQNSPSTKVPMRRPPDTHGNHLRLCQVKNAARFHGCRVVVASGNGRDGCMGKLLRVHERRHQPVLLIVEAQSSLRSSALHPHLARLHHSVWSPQQAANRTFDLQDSSVCH